MAGVSPLEGDGDPAQSVIDRTQRRRSTRPPCLHRHDRSSPHSVWNLQNHSPVYEPSRQEGIGWSIKSCFSSRLAPQHSRASS